MKSKMFRLLLIVFVSVLAQGSAQAGLSALLEPITLEQPKPQDNEKPSVRSENNTIRSVRHAIKEAGAMHEEYLERKTYKISQEDIERELSMQLGSYYNEDGELKVSLNRPFDTMEVNSADWILTIKEYPAPKISNSILVRFSVEVAGTDVSTYKVGARLELWKKTYISKKRINKGEDINERDLSVREVDVLKVRGTPVPFGVDFGIYEADQSIPEDDVLVLRDLYRKPDVRKGDIIDVVASEGLMHVALKARALEDGIRNEYITVRNEETSKKIQVLITDEGKAEVSF